MLKIERKAETGKRVTFRLFGKVTSEHVAEVTRLTRLARRAGKKVTLDLEGVGLIDRGAMEFFSHGDGCDVKLLHCPQYVREWLRCERRKVNGKK